MKLIDYLNQFAVCTPHVVVSIPVSEMPKHADNNLRCINGSKLWEAFWFEEQNRASSYLVLLNPNSDSGGINIEGQDLEKAEYTGHAGIWKSGLEGVPMFLQFIPLLPHACFGGMGTHH
jgi:hypothetical protein